MAHSPLHVPLLALLGLALACATAGAQGEEAELLGSLEDPARLGAHADAALALGRLETPGPAVEGALTKALASRDPIVAACAARALGAVCHPTEAILAALTAAQAYPATLEAPSAGGAGWAAVEDRAFRDTVLFRGGSGWTDWVVFRTWDTKTVAVFLHAPRRGGTWNTKVHDMLVVQASPVVMEVVGSSPTTRWSLDAGGKALTLESTARSTRPHAAVEPGGLQALVVETAQVALYRILLRADENAFRRALRHPAPSVRAAALRVLGGERDAAPFPGELFEILFDDARDRAAVRAFKKVGPAAGPILAAAIAAADPVRRDLALEWTTILRGDAKAAIPAVAGLVEEGHVVAPPRLFDVISAVGEDAAAATNALRAFVRNRREHYELALDTLADIGPGAKAAVPELVDVARTRPGFGHGRLRATLALAAIAPGHAELPAFVAACLADPNSNVIELACLHVGGWSKVHPTIRRALRRATKHADGRVRAAAEEALRRLDG